MKVLDANVLLYAYDADSAHHSVCRAWLEAAFNDPREIVALPWQTILAFVRIATNPRAVRQPLTSATACKIDNEWLSRPNVTTVGYGERFWALFSERVTEGKVHGPLITDAALAAITLEQGATLYRRTRTFDVFQR